MTYIKLFQGYSINEVEGDVSKYSEANKIEITGQPSVSTCILNSRCLITLVVVFKES